MQSEAKKILARDNSETAKTLNADIEAAMRMIEGTARSMGFTVED